MKLSELGPLGIMLRVHNENGEKTKKLYFLLDKGDVVYIGMTTQIYTRALNHRKDKVFDEIQFLEFPQRHDTHKLEKSLIFYFKPKYNDIRYPGVHKLMEDILESHCIVRKEGSL